MKLRQKLARFNSPEFSLLLIEILIDSRRRYHKFDLLNNTIETSSIKLKKQPKKSTESEADNFLDDDGDDEEDPLYDKVPSDEDYASVASESSTNMVTESNKKSKLIRPDQSLTLNILKSGANSKPIKSTTPSPSNSKMKVLTTNFDKPQALSNNPACTGPASTLVANAESALNSIMNSLNQIDYSHLTSPQHGHEHDSPKLSSDIYSRDRLNHVNVVNDVAGNVSVNELKEENNLMQAMVCTLLLI